MSGVAPAAPVTPAPAPTSQTQSGTVAAAATPGTVPQTAALAATVVNPPAALARLAAGTLLDGQVLARDTALKQAIVRTIYGQITLQLTNPPAEGSRIALQLQAAIADGRAALVTAEPPTPGPGRGEAAARAPAPPPASATINNPPETLARLPAGTTIEGRVLPADQRGQVTVQTSHGALALRTPVALPPGARVALQIQPNPSGVAGQLPARVTVLALPVAAATAAEPPAATVALSSTALSASAQNAAAEPASAAIVAQAPALKLAPGMVLDGRVVGADDQGAAVVQTAQGPLALRTPLPLAPGAKVLLQVPPDGGNQIAIVAIDGRPLVRALPGLAIEGRVVATDAQGATIVQTAQGPVAVRSPLPLPPGTAVTLQLPLSAAGQPVVVAVDGRPIAPATPQLALPTPAALVNPAEPTLALAREWPALSDAVAAISRAAPDGVAARTLDVAVPRPGLNLAPTLALALGALREGNLKRWLGDAPTDTLTKVGRPDLAVRVGDEFAKLARLAEPPASQQDWRVYLVPFHDGQQLQQMQLFTRRHKQNGGDAGGDEITARFVFDVELTRLGRIQLDGLAGEKRFDLMVRSRAPLSDEMRRHIALLFGASREEGGFQGEVGFQTVAEFPVAPLDERDEPAPHGIVI